MAGPGGKSWKEKTPSSRSLSTLKNWDQQA